MDVSCTGSSGCDLCGAGKYAGSEGVIACFDLWFGLLLHLEWPMTRPKKLGAAIVTAYWRLILLWCVSIDRDDAYFSIAICSWAFCIKPQDIVRSWWDELRQSNTSQVETGWTDVFSTWMLWSVQGLMIALIAILDTMLLAQVVAISLLHHNYNLHVLISTIHFTCFHAICVCTYADSIFHDRKPDLNHNGLMKQACWNHHCYPRT